MFFPKWVSVDSEFVSCVFNAMLIVEGRYDATGDFIITRVHPE